MACGKDNCAHDSGTACVSAALLMMTETTAFASCPRSTAYEEQGDRDRRIAASWIIISIHSRKSNCLERQQLRCIDYVDLRDFQSMQKVAVAVTVTAKT